MTSFLELCAARYSVRAFSPKPVEREKIDALVESARLAPSAKNDQPVRLLVVQSAEALAKLRALSPCTYGAPLVFVVCYDRGAEWRNPLEEGVHSGVEDASIAATQMMLEAKDLGLDSCWVNYFAPSKVADAFGLSADFVPVLLLPVGYAAAGAAPSPSHASRKAPSQWVREL